MYLFLLIVGFVFFADAQEGESGKTWVTNLSTGQVGTGNYKPTEEGSAHERLALDHGIPIGSETIGGSIKADGSIEFRSASLNTAAVGEKDASKSPLAQEALSLLQDANTNLYVKQEGGGYRYNNADGSFYYKNADGSTYYDNGKGYTKYSPPPSSGGSQGRGKGGGYGGGGYGGGGYGGGGYGGGGNRYKNYY